ncbi:hypothetical protein [Gordonia phthalatica]|uniref:Lipoprotein n=1 Tax=Gordonia phthalatica TaxID=1136941 RepID=A0A0N9NCC4_9ACTN|nr:hypothetical protein [Gordonia phthalatica]ALG85324.1 hypothetical protein ACH46_13625 [Gordonia phthalatica]
MTGKIRLALASVVASAALLGGAVAPAAQAAPAAPTGQALAAKTALDNIKPTDAAGVIDGIAAANALLEKLKITPFTPTLGACTDFTLAPALGGAMPGPNTPLVGDVTIGGIDLNAVKKGEVLYGFVPVGTFDDTGSKSGMQVAWFNVNTFQGNIGEPMDGLADTLVKALTKRIEEAKIPLLSGPLAKAAAEKALKPVLDALPSNGVRGGLVETGSGTVLSAIYGTIKKGDATCFFFPSLGIATTK